MISRAAATFEVARSLERVPGGVMRVELVRGIEGFRALEHDWRRLAASTAGGNPFLAWEWTVSWAETMMASRLETAVVRDGDEVVAIAPFYRNRYAVGPGVKADCLQLYGPRELQTVFELRQIPMTRGREAAIMRGLLDGLLRSEPWDWLELGDYGTRVERWREVLAELPLRMRLVTEDTYQVPILQLLPTWEEQKSALRRNVKERIRRGYNSLKRDDLAFSVEVDSDPSTCEARLAEFHRLHELRAQMVEHKEHGNSFRHLMVRSFLAAAAPRMMGAGILSFASLKVGGGVVATRLFFERDASLYLYYSGFEPSWWDRSVMTLLVTEIVKSAIARGVQSVNFSPGLDQFKSGWTDPEANLTTSSFMVGRETPLARFRLSAFRRRKRMSSLVTSRVRQVRGHLRSRV